MKPKTIALILFAYFLPFAWIFFFTSMDVGTAVSFFTLVLVAGSALIMLEDLPTQGKGHWHGKHKLH